MTSACFTADFDVTVEAASELGTLAPIRHW